MNNAVYKTTSDMKYIHDFSESDLLKIDFINLTDEQEAASLVFKRRDRFVEGSNYLFDLTDMLKTYFGDLKKLHNTGLIKQYESLKVHVETKGIIGLILTGINIHEVVINNYMRLRSSNPIELTIASLCRTLIRNYFTELEVNTLSMATPNFNIYIDHVKKNDKFVKTGRFKVKSFVASPPRLNRSGTEKI